MLTPRQRPLKVRFVLQQEPLPYGEKPELSEPSKIFDFYNSVISKDVNFEEHKENVIVVAIDARLRLIGYNIISVGTIVESSAHPREIFRPVLALNGYGFILIHNHPSGDPSPSRADEIVTRRTVEAASLLDLRLFDHLIAGKHSPGRFLPYFLFKEAGIVP